MVHFHGFFSSANNDRDDINIKDGPEPLVNVGQLQRNCTGVCPGRYFISPFSYYLLRCM